MWCVALYCMCRLSSALQCVAECCRVLQCVAVCCMCCSVLQCVAVCCSVLQCVAECCSVSQCAVCVAYVVCCSVLQCAVVCCSVLQCVAVCCSVLQRVACVAYLVCCGVLQRVCGWVGGWVGRVGCVFVGRIFGVSWSNCRTSSLRSSNNFFSFSEGRDVSLSGRSFPVAFSKHTHTTHTHIYIYIYMYFLSFFLGWRRLNVITGLSGCCAPD